MDSVGRSLRIKLHWIKDDEMIYLVMDQVGRHVLDKSIKNYKKDLLEKYNVCIISQALWLIYCNILDLGVWCGLQTAIEKNHNN